MQNKKIQKLMAGMLATTMLMASTLTVFAEESEPTSGTSTGSGAFEGYVEETYAKVSLPTVEEGTYNYLVDPNGLIVATEGAAHSGIEFEQNKKLFFTNSATSMTSASNKATVINLGTDAIDVTVSATVSALPTGVSLAATEEALAGNTAAQIFMQLNVSNGLSETPEGEAVNEKTAIATAADTAAEITVGLAGNPDNFEIVYANDAYAFAQKTGVQNTNFNSFEFWLNGDCNSHEGWESTSIDTAGSIAVTWSFEARADESTEPMLAENAVEYKAEAAPSIATTTYVMTAGTDLAVNVDLGKGDKAANGIAGVTYTVSGGSAADMATNYSFADNVLTIKAKAIDYIISKGGASVTVKFNDTNNTEVVLSLTVAE